MKVIVQFSGGKDSHACLIWAVNKYGKKNVRAVFCDTYWDSPFTYKHIQDTCKLLDVELKTISSSKYDSFTDMAIKKGRMPSALMRFCTTELKVNPFVDYLLSEVRESVLIIQGIRALESKKRSEMPKSCTYFKYYFESYRTDKRGSKVYFNYRKKEVANWLEFYDDSLFRPVFDWSGQDVIDYIISHGHKPNVLYYLGFKRVGCFPCVMSSMTELRELITRFPERIKLINDFEDKTGQTFFSYDYIPAKYRTGVKINKSGKEVKISTSRDIFKYVKEKYVVNTLFDDADTPSCSSFFHLCE